MPLYVRESKRGAEKWFQRWWREWRDKHIHHGEGDGEVPGISISSR